MKNTFTSIMIIAMLGLLSSRSIAQCHVYVESPNNFNVVGSASNTGTGCFQLTNNNTGQAGAAWCTSSADLTHDFDVSFNVNQCGSADGMVFVMQDFSNGTNAVGGTGSDLGYYGATALFTHSLGVELDIYNSSGAPHFDPDNSHIGIMRDGLPTSLVSTVHISPYLGNCATRPFRLTWNATSQVFSVYYDGTLQTSYTGDLVNDVFGGNHTIFFGFTGATGGEIATQSFCVNYLDYYGSHELTVNGPSTICPGYTLELTAPASDSYSWSTGETTQSISVNATGNYSADVITNGCAETLSSTITVAAMDTAVIYSSGGFQYCPNSNIELNIDANARYSSISWSTGATTTNTSVTAGGAQSVTVSDALGCSATSHAVLSSPPGDESGFGDHVWQVNAYENYNTGSYYYYYYGIDPPWLESNYSGYYIDDSLNFNTEHKWGIYGSPSDADNYHGCYVSADYFSFKAKRKGFDCGIYQIDMPGHDDNTELWVDGIKVFEHTGCCDSHTNVWTGELNPNSTVEFMVNEYGGLAYGSLHFTVVGMPAMADYYVDADGDGFGSSSASAVSSCISLTGYVTNNTDCNDGSAAVNTSATEVCNDVDDNCNGTIDEGLKSTFYADADGDSYGSLTVSTLACSLPSGYVSNSTDCNDGSASVHPGATEVCNDVDDNCNGTIDEGLKSTFYADADGDGYGNAASTTQACSVPSGYVSNTTDCNDANGAVNPVHAEVCGNSIDDNCNGVADEGCCGNATAFSTTNITKTSATLNWTAATNPAQWQVQYKTTSPGSQWVNVTPNPVGSARSVSITGLTKNQNYQWHIRAKCGTIWTDYSGVIQFKTLAVRVEDEGTPTELKAYPNPSNGNFIVELTPGETVDGSVQIELINSLGQMVYNSEAPIVDGVVHEEINLQGQLVAGRYFVRVISGENLTVSQLIIAD